MSRRSRRGLCSLLAALAGVVALAIGSQSAVAGTSGGSGGGAPQHVFLIVMENHAYNEIIGNTADAPFTNWLAGLGNVENNYYGVTHPSLPNYLSLFSGDFQGIWDDCAAGASVTCPPEEFVPNSGDATSAASLTAAQIASSSAMPHLFAGRNLVDQLESRGLTWRAYMQSLPSVGSQVEYAPTLQTPTGPQVVKLYAQKHNPFMYFSDVNYPGSRRLRSVVPFEDRFARDLRSGNVPNLAWISPDQCHDMHGVSPSGAALINLPQCGYPVSGLDHGAIQLGDAFLRDTVTAITSSRVWRSERSSIVVVWDEDDYAGYSGCCGSPVGVGGVTLGGAQAPLIVLNSNGHGGGVVSVPANHYSLLATLERLWNLGCLANTCSIPRSGLLTSMFDH
jgi:hypothetical protein